MHYYALLMYADMTTEWNTARTCGEGVILVSTEIARSWPNELLLNVTDKNVVDQRNSSDRRHSVPYGIQMMQGSYHKAVGRAV